MFALAVHGGAGHWEQGAHAGALDGLRRAASAAEEVLAAGGASLDAVIAAVVVLEDDPLFNAGTGATLNLEGEAECDACVMTGQDLRAGAVTAVRGVKNPILLARKILEE